MNKSFAKDFLKTFEELPLPKEISKRFEIIGFLGQNSFSETYKIFDRKSGELFVLKRCSKTDEIPYYINEADILQSLSFRGLPKFIKDLTIEKDGFLFTVREYIDGITLEEYILGLGCNEVQSVDIIMELCDILTYLHSQGEPVIHRDIKPSNIIIDKENKNISLIDFGICRKYSESAQTDTVCFGTEKFAPPEQYGFSQTDCRADIYALGILLRYMLTGSVDKKIVISKRGLEKIATKCSEFSPERRYQSAKAVKKALWKYKKHLPQISLIAVSVPLLVILIFISVWYMIFVKEIQEVMFNKHNIISASDEARQLLTEDKETNESYNIVDFKEPLIEKAARCVLGKDDGEDILYEDLDNIASLYIVGDKVATTNEEFITLLNKYGDSLIGNIESLEDCKYMSNLKRISITGQPLSDISSLSFNTKLVELDILFCSISDASPISELPNLIFINLYDNLIEDYSIFEGMESLKWLSVGKTPIRTIDELGHIPNISFIHLGATKIVNLEGIEKFDTLESINIYYNEIKDFSPLDNLPLLNEIEISKDMEQYLDTLSRDDLEIIIR